VSGSCGQFIALHLCRSFLLTLFPGSSVGSTHERQSSTKFSNVGPSHVLRSFKNCSSMRPFHGVQSFRNRLLQRGSPAGSQVLQKTCSGVGSSPQCYRSCQEPPPVWVLHRLIASFRAYPASQVWGPQEWTCSAVDLHGLQGNNMRQHGLCHRLRTNLCSGTWNTSSPSFFIDLGVCRVVSLTDFHSFPSAAAVKHFFYPFLNMLSQRHYQQHWPSFGQRWVCLGSGWH